MQSGITLVSLTVKYFQCWLISLISLISGTFVNIHFYVITGYIYFRNRQPNKRVFQTRRSLQELVTALFATVFRKSEMTSTNIEFAVQMTCESCVKTVRKSLEKVPGIEHINVDLKKNSVTVQTTLPAEDVLKHLQSSGKKAVIRGLGGIVAGVVILDTGLKDIRGVVRFVQEQENVCIVDGTVDGLQQGKHILSIHECGDTSQGCESIGDFYNPNGAKERIYGDLGIVQAEEDGRSAFRFDNSTIKLSDVIGRALVISEATSGKRLACGIIARSSGLFQNPKTICACDGVTIWNEKITQKQK